MKDKKLFYINLIYYIALVLVAVVFVLGYLDIFKNDWLPSILIQIVIISAIPILMYSLLVSKNLKQTFADFGFKKLSAKLLFLSILIALILYSLNVFISESAASLVYLLGFETVIPALNISNKAILNEFFLTACLPGICEEILHRGMMLTGCKKHGYTRYGLIFSSLLFGFMHLNILQFIYATILGFLMGKAVLATESIWTGVICHFTNNFLSIYFSYDKGWPLQKLKLHIITLLDKLNPIMFVIVGSLIMLTLIHLYRIIINHIYKMKLSLKTKELAEELKSETEELSSDERVEEINKRLQQLSVSKMQIIKDKKQTFFVDKIFLYSSISLGSFAILFSYIIGIL